MDKRQPNKQQFIDEGSNNVLEWAGGSMQGWRDSQEDAHLCKLDIGEDIHLFAVFDGHGGSCVSKFCEDHFLEELLKQPTFIDGSDYKLALRESCLIMDRRLRTPEGLQEIYTAHGGKEEVKWQEIIDVIMQALKDGNQTDEAPLREKRPDAGTTANIMLMVKNKIYLANVGDSRTCINENGEPKALSEDHKPFLQREADRVTSVGGFIIHGRVGFKLSLTRAIGDLNYKSKYDKDESEQVIIAVPDIEVYEFDKAKNPFIIMGCDGIWEKDDANSDNNTQVQAFIPNHSLKEIISQNIFNRLCARRSDSEYGTDNMTCILIKFK